MGSSTSSSPWVVVLREKANQMHHHSIFAYAPDEDMAIEGALGVVARMHWHDPVLAHEEWDVEAVTRHE